MDITQTRVKILEHEDSMILESMENRYGYDRILEHIEVSLSLEKKMAEFHEDTALRRSFSNLENKVRLLILEFQKENIS